MKCKVSTTRRSLTYGAPWPFPRRNPEGASAREALADLYRIQGRYSDAEQLLKCALKQREEVSGPHHIDICQSLSLLGILYETQGRHAEAEPWRRRCLSIR